MKRRQIFASILAAIPLLSGTVSAAPTDDAQQRLRQAVDEVLAVANRVATREDLSNKVRPVLERHVSFETMTRRAVGVGWRQFSPDQQRKATQLFTTLVIRTYSNKFTPGSQSVINFLKPTSPTEGRVDVPTTLVYAGSRYSVTYRLELAGSWKIVDVVIEGVSLVANYRTQLDSTFKKSGAAAVISSLENSASNPK